MTALYLLATIAVFLLSKRLLSGFLSPFANPLLMAIVVFILVFSCTPLSVDDYLRANQWLVALLEPAVVALAIPLFQQLNEIKRRLWPIILSCLLGVIAGVSSCMAIALWLGADHQLLMSLLPKSVTSPIAMAIAVQAGGIPSLAAAVVIMVGLFGAVVGFPLLRRLGIHDPATQGMAIGCSAHAIGTAQAIYQGQQQGAFSSLALVLTGIFTALLTPLLLWLIY